MNYRNSKYQNRISYEGWCRGESFIPKTITPALLPFQSVRTSRDDAKGGVFSAMALRMISQGLADSLPVFIEAARSVREYESPILWEKTIIDDAPAPVWSPR